MQEYICSALKTETNFHTATLQSLIKKIVVSANICCSHKISNQLSLEDGRRKMSLLVDALGLNSFKKYARRLKLLHLLFEGHPRSDNF